MRTRVLATGSTSIVLAMVFAVLMTAVARFEVFVEPLRVLPPDPAPVTLRLAPTRVHASEDGTVHVHTVVPRISRGEIVDDPVLGSGRLFTSDVARLKAVYTLNARSWLRLIGQWVETERDAALYRDETTAHAADLSGSVTFAYKLNWQTVLYVGYSDLQELEPERDTLEPASRELFLKVSYAFRG